jgi:O-antigen/teichoic acid export membrane protein
VGLPAFSKLQDTRSRRSAYLRSVRFASVVLFPLGALGTVFADLVVRLVLGGKWIPTTPLLRQLIWAGIFTALSGVSTAFLQAVDRPNISARAAILKFGLFALVVFPVMRAYGLNGVALAAMISSPIGFTYLYGRAAGVLGWGWDIVGVFRPGLNLCAPAFVGFAVNRTFTLPHSEEIIAALACISSIAFMARQLGLSRNTVLRTARWTADPSKETLDA